MQYEVQFNCPKDDINSIHDLFYSRMDDFPFLVTDWAQSSDPDDESKMTVWIIAHVITDAHLTFLKNLLTKHGATDLFVTYE